MSVALAVKQLIAQALQSRTGFSAIRINDGEAKLLGTPEFYSGTDLTFMLHRWFGENQLSMPNLSALRNEVMDAIETADFIGLPALDWPAEFSLANTIVQRILGARCTRTGPVDFPQSMLADGSLRDVLASAERVVLISCRDVRPFVIEHFGIRNPLWLPVPEQAIYHYGAELPRHFPDRYFELQSLIAALPPSLVLVGAGPCGKGYCAAVKRAGGVAIDIGSMFDQWAGRSTRPDIDYSIALKHFETRGPDALSAAEGTGLAEIHHASNRPDAALDVLESLRERLPTDVALLAKQIELLFAAERRDTAQSKLHQAQREHAPLKAEAALRLSIFCDRAGEKEIAMHLLEQGLVDDPGHIGCLTRLCAMVCDHPQLAAQIGEVASRLPGLAVALAAHSDNHEFVFQTARLIGSTGDIETAIRLGEQAAGLFSLEPTFFRHLESWYAYKADDANMLRCQQHLHAISGPSGTAFHPWR